MYDLYWSRVHAHHLIIIIIIIIIIVYINIVQDSVQV